MSTLFEIVAQANEIEKSLIESGGEVSQELEAQISRVDLTMRDKIDAYSIVMGRLDVAAEYWAEKANEYYRISKSVKTAKERIKESIKIAMKAMDKTEISGATVRFKISQSKASLKVNIAELPTKYKTLVTEAIADNDSIRKDLECGFDIPGARLEQTYSLRQYAAKEIK